VAVMRPYVKLLCSLVNNSDNSDNTDADKYTKSVVAAESEVLAVTRLAVTLSVSLTVTLFYTSQFTRQKIDASRARLLMFFLAHVIDNCS